MTSLEGGCLCGAVHYRLATAARDVGYCHCTTCRRSGGGPAMVWATVPRADLAFLRGVPAAYRSSSFAERRFCAACGSQLTFVSDREPEDLDLNVATLDDPAALPPSRHVWHRDRVPWFETADDLPRHAGSSHAPEGTEG